MHLRCVEPSQALTDVILHPLTSPLITHEHLTNPSQAYVDVHGAFLYSECAADVTRRLPNAAMDAWTAWLWSARRGLLIEFPESVLQTAFEHKRSVEVQLLACCLFNAQ